MIPTICVVGAGRMGSSIARALLSKGYRTAVWNRTLSRCQPLAEAGAEVLPTVEEAIRTVDVIIVNVLDMAASEALLRRNSIAPLLAGKVIVQLTSASARLAREEARWLASHGTRYLDGAIMATPDFIGTPEAALLYSGSREAFEANKDLLLTLGGGTTFVGDIPGQASALDTALLAQLWGGLFGTLQALAVVEAEDLSLDTFEGQLAAFKPVVDAAVIDLVDRTRSRRFAGDAKTLASLGAHHSAFQHLLAACEERGLNAALPRAMDTVFRQGLAEQGSDSDFASLAPLFRRRQSSVASGEQAYA